MSEQVFTATQAMTKTHKNQPQPEWVKATELDELDAAALLRKHNLYCGVKLASSGAILVDAFEAGICEVAEVLAGMGLYPDDSVVAIHEVNQKHAWQFNISYKYGRLAQRPLAYPFYKITDEERERAKDEQANEHVMRYGY